MASQCKEDLFIVDYLKEYQSGTFLDIGANDGKVMSNVLPFIEKGWSGAMIEASPLAFERLEKNHGENKNVHLYNYALTNYDDECIFYESGYVKIKGRADNISLVSTINKDWLRRWKGKAHFKEIKIPCKSFSSFLQECPIKKFDFITIDIEGESLNALKQMDLKELDCKIICLEHDGYKEVDEYIEYCAQFGLKELTRTKVNIILGL